MPKVIIDNHVVVSIKSNADIFTAVEELHSATEYERGKMQRQMQRELHALSTEYNSTQADFSKKIAELEANQKALEALLLKIIDGAPLDIKEI